MKRAAPIQRTPMKRKAAKKRRVAAKCVVLRCKRRPSVRGLCMTHARTKADQAFSSFIRQRDGRCQAAVMFPDIACSEGLQCMHLISRRYRTTRWDEDNALAGCAAHHKYLTEHPLEHDLFCERNVGVHGWSQMKQRALAGTYDEGATLEDWLDPEAAA